MTASINRAAPLVLSLFTAGCSGLPFELGSDSAAETETACDRARTQMNDWALSMMPPASEGEQAELQRLALATEQACAETALAAPGLNRDDAALAAAYAIQRRFPDALRVLADAPQQNSPESLILLANLVGQGLGTDKDPRRAAALLERAGQVGDSDIKIRVAQEFLAGGSVERDPERARAFYQAAIDQGSDAALLAYATDYLGLFRRGTEPPQLQQALGLVRRAATELNSGDAMSMLAGYYLSEHGRDLALAEQWADRALAAGNKRAYRAKGLVAFSRFRQAAASNQREDYSRDPLGAEAVKWFREGAEAGDSQSALYLGELYYNGVGVARDPAEAVGWLRTAKAGGNRQATLLLREIAERSKVPAASG